MARAERSELIDESTVGVYHCTSRCVRGAFLGGEDPRSGRNYDHRREQIQQRLEFLAGQFGIDVLGFCIMSDHLHVVLRNRPDVVAAWSKEQVARRWWNLFPLRRDEQGQPAKPQPQELATLTAETATLRDRRARLSSISWLMRCLCEGIARQANREDQYTGRFWAGRFKCQALLDEAAVLACSVYVDLNPIRAGVVTTLERCQYTSVYQRIQANKQLLPARRKSAKARKPAKAKRPAASAVDGWLSPVELKQAKTGGRTAARSPRRRASNLGFLPVTLTEYLRLLDWTGQQIRREKRGAIPADLAPILERLHVADETWIDQVQNFGRWYRLAAGRATTLAKAAEKRGRRWLHGVGHSREAFT